MGFGVGHMAALASPAQALSVAVDLSIFYYPG
jgi:hypothetical protein